MNLRALLIAVFATLALLPGCASAPVTRYYVLSATAQGPLPRTRPAIAVVITDVRLPPYLERPQMVTRSGDYRLQIAEYEQWAGDLRQDMTRVLTQNLGRLLNSERVVAAPHAFALQPDYRLEVEVLRFEPEPGGRVALAARWWLTRGADAAPGASQSVTLLGAPLGANASYEVLVASMSSVYAEFAQAVARSIRAHGAGGA